jgi:dTDP-4-dehydrorhamnose 3,5-epimerase
MEFTATPTLLDGVVLIQPRVFPDARGFFLETWSAKDFAAAGIAATFVQDSQSRSTLGVIRGLHYQDARAPQAKLVRCTLGSIFDVAVDIRHGSPTFGQWTSVELTAENKLMLFIPPGFAHGFRRRPRSSRCSTSSPAITRRPSKEPSRGTIPTSRSPGRFPTRSSPTATVWAEASRHTPTSPPFNSLDETRVRRARSTRRQSE